MRKIIHRICLIVIFACSGWVIGAAGDIGGERAEAVPTYNACGLYLPGGSGVCEARHRNLKDNVWKKSFNLYHDEAAGMFRGSIVDLDEDSEYEAALKRVEKNGETKEFTVRFKTWSSNPPVRKTVHIKNIRPGEPLVISDSGNERGWIKYDGGGQCVVNNDTDHNSHGVLIKDSKFVILENLVVRGGYRGVKVSDSQQVRVINCDVSGFGTVGARDLTKKGNAKGRYYTPDGEESSGTGVFLINSCKVTVERCYVHDPLTFPSSWYHSRPSGAQAFRVGASPGFHVREIVVRYNDFMGGDEHFWADCVDLLENGHLSDTDVYGNLLAFANDDAIELDGDQINVRFSRNKCEGCFTGVSVTPCVSGPSYVYRNIIAELGDTACCAGLIIKTGGGEAAPGTCFVFHNTARSRGYVEGSYPRKPEGVPNGPYLCLRNNIIWSLDSKHVIDDPYKWDRNSYDYDLLFGGKPLAKAGIEEHGIFARPVFRDAAGGDYRLSGSSPGIEAGQIIENFSDNYKGKAPDMGAYDSGHGELIPARPVTLRPDKTRITLRSGPSEPNPSDTFSVRAGSAAAVRDLKFKILKNNSCGWFSVSPPEGTLKTEGDNVFTVTFETKNARGCYHRGGFILKLESGYSIPVTVYGEISKPELESVLEAEAAAVPAHPFKVTADSGASDGRCVFIDNSDGVRVYPEEFPGALVLPFTIRESGYYAVLARVKSLEPVGEHDSLYVSFDSAPRLATPYGWGWFCAMCGPDWGWAPLTQGDGENVMRFEAGEHALRIYPKKTGLLIDQILISPSPVLPCQVLQKTGRGAARDRR